MKTRLNHSTGRRCLGSGPPAAALALLLTALSVTAQTDTPYMATGWVIGVPVSGVWCTNALGQVGFRGNTHVARVESTDARLTGRRTIYVDGAAQADGPWLPIQELPLPGMRQATVPASEAAQIFRLRQAP